MHLSTLWRNALLFATRQLRQSVVKDKIWVDSSNPMDSYISHSQAGSIDFEGLPPDATEELAPNLGRYHAQMERNIEPLAGRRDGHMQEGR